MAEERNTALQNDSSADSSTQKQVVKNLIANKKKTSGKQEIAEFTREWIKLERDEGITNGTISLLIDGFSIAGAAPLFAIMDSDESCRLILKDLKQLPVVVENDAAASLRMYTHLFALSVNAGREWNCINSILSAIPRYAYNKEHKPFGTNPSTISKYLLRELDVEKAKPVLARASLQEEQVSKLARIFKPAFNEAMQKTRPVKREVSSVNLLTAWLERNTVPKVKTSAIAMPVDYPGSVPSAATGAEPMGVCDHMGDSSGKPVVSLGEGKKSAATYESVILSIRELERSHSRTIADLSATEDAVKKEKKTVTHLESSLKEANCRIEIMKKTGAEKQCEIDAAKRRIESLENELEEMRSTAKAHAEMISMLDKNREQKGNEALARIASKLKADYGDFKEYENEPMTPELGEIARLQLSQVFETLKTSGVSL